MGWQAAVERTVIGMGYELVDVEKAAGGLLRVYIDQPAGGAEFITVDDCEKVTRQLQHVLEVEGGSYERLEVSSPGLDRPLTKLADYTRFAGEEAELRLRAPVDGKRKVKGLLRGVEGDSVLVETPAGMAAVAFADIGRARLVPKIEWRK